MLSVMMDAFLFDNMNDGNDGGCYKFILLEYTICHTCSCDDHGDKDTGDFVRDWGCLT